LGTTLRDPAYICKYHVKTPQDAHHSHLACDKGTKTEATYQPQSYQSSSAVMPQVYM